MVTTTNETYKQNGITNPSFPIATIHVSFPFRVSNYLYCPSLHVSCMCPEMIKFGWSSSKALLIPTEPTWSPDLILSAIVSNMGPCDAQICAVPASMNLRYRLFAH